jgi:hypothetical protein
MPHHHYSVIVNHGRSDGRKPVSAEMCFIRKTGEYILLKCKRYEEMMTEL